MRKQTRIIGHACAVFSLLLAGLYSVRIRSFAGTTLFLAKQFAEALAPLVMLMGAVGVGLGMLRKMPLAIAAGGTGAALAMCYVRGVTTAHDEAFEEAFGIDWAAGPQGVEADRLPRRPWTWRPLDAPNARWDRDMVFWTLPDGDRHLLCDIWQPAESVTPSGIGVVYLHGGAWHLLDKDFGTRPMFRHLAAQGHVVMDVGYRLCPEVDVLGMVGDAKRAVAWLKRNAARYGVDPSRVVLAGASSGAHIALLAAYAPGHPLLTPDDLSDIDTSVRAVVDYYGPTDMLAHCANADVVDHAPSPGGGGQGLLAMIASATRPPGLPSNRQIMQNLLGGQPEEVPWMYAVASPLNHVSSASPPTLLFHGEDDFLVPVNASRALHHKLVAKGVPSVCIELPRTEHAFDLALPQVSPVAHASLYILDRFLTIMASNWSVPLAPISLRQSR